jgi:hypothetical protein
MHVSLALVLPELHLKSVIINQLTYFVGVEKILAQHTGSGPAPSLHRRTDSRLSLIRQQLCTTIWSAYE